MHSRLKTSPGASVTFPDERNGTRMYTSARNRLRGTFSTRTRWGSPSCESSRTIFFHATVNSRAYTAGCCLLSGAVALKSLGETQEERILTNLKKKREREYVCVCVYVCVCSRVCEEERERKKKQKRIRIRDRVVIAITLAQSDHLTICDPRLAFEWRVIRTKNRY